MLLNIPPDSSQTFIMIRRVCLKLTVPLQEIRRAPIWTQCGETRMGTVYLSRLSRVTYSTPNGNDDFENRRKLLTEISKLRRQEETMNRTRKGKMFFRKLFFVMVASSSAVMMATLGYMAYNPSFRVFQRTESPRISRIADFILGAQMNNSSDGDTGPSIEDDIQKQRLRDLRRQRETAQCSPDVQ